METAGEAGEIRTHQALNRRLCGEPVEVSANRAVVRLVTSADMAADDRGLVHGGFVFGLADHAAMLAVNHPLVVLGTGAMRFLAPVRVGEAITAAAEITEQSGRRRQARVSVHRGDELVAAGDFTCFVPERHVLDRSGPAGG